MSLSLRCGPTALAGRWAAPTPRPLSAQLDRIFNAFDRTNSIEYVKTTTLENGHLHEERTTGAADIVVNRRLSSSFSGADCRLAAQSPALDEDLLREKVLDSQQRQLYPLQEDLADWINKTIGITYLTGDNFLEVLDNGVELCQLAAVIHDTARDAFDQGLYLGPVPSIRGRCWERAARRSFFSRDNTDNFLTFCRDLGVHENLLFESDDLVLHNQPRQVVLCLLEVSRLAARAGLEPPGLVRLETEIAREEQDLADAALWQPSVTSRSTQYDPQPSSDEPNDDPSAAPDNTDAESTRSGGTDRSADSDEPLRPTTELDKRVQLVTRLMERGCICAEGRCNKLLKVKKVGEGRYNIAGRNVFIRLLKGRHMMVRVGGGWDTLEHFLSRHEPCQVRLVTAGRRAALLPVTPSAPPAHPAPPDTDVTDDARSSTSGTSSSDRSTPPRRGTPPSALRRRTPVDPAPLSPRPAPSRSSLSLPLRPTPDPRPRKQSAPSPLSTPRRTPPAELRKSVTSTSLAETPKKTRTGVTLQKAERRLSCGPERTTPLRRGPGRSASLATTPTEPGPLKARSVSLASTPTELPGLKARGLTQAAIEDSVRRSLAGQPADKPFLHIKAKYRSPPPRDVPHR